MENIQSLALPAIELQTTVVAETGRAALLTQVPITPVITYRSALAGLALLPHFAMHTYTTTTTFLAGIAVFPMLAKSLPPTLLAIVTESAVNANAGTSTLLARILLSPVVTESVLRSTAFLASEPKDPVFAHP
mmetsp:Transcript_38623/g.75868  ORF Transcript_38623/g.75868 Transcript_38623/m.75868 type:complete len:133 (-) Transcript_38623:788-1186(-)